MIKSLKDLFEAILPPDAAKSTEDPKRLLQLATAVLLVEVMRAEPAIGAPERRAVIDALRRQFGLSADDTDHLVSMAEQEAVGATDYFAFTSRINEGFDMAQKLLVIENMWRVAYADGTLGAHENHLMRKVADLLYIPQGAYVHAKMRARDASGAT